MKFSLIIALFITTSAWARFSVTTYNIRNFDKDPGAGQTNVVLLGKTIKEFKSDVMTFIEVINLDAFKKLIQDNLPGYTITHSQCGGTGRQKLAIVFDSTKFELVNSAEDLSFSSQTGDCGSLRPIFLTTLKEKSSSKAYTFGAVHLKAGGAESAMRQRWQQYEKLKVLVDRLAKQNVILMGDFNTTGYNIKDQDYVQFEDFLAQKKFRTTSESLGCTSYWEGTLGNGQHQSSILDHIVLKDTQMAEVAEVSLGAHCAELSCRPATPTELGATYESVSDHCPIKVTFK